MIGVLLATCVICLVLSGLAAITDWWQDSWQRDVDRARRFRAALAPDDRRRPR